MPGVMRSRKAAVTSPGRREDDMGGYIVVKNCGSVIGEYEINTSKPIAEELIRVIQQERLIFEEGDTISFESK
jgi:hypothetical protein